MVGIFIMFGDNSVSDIAGRRQPRRSRLASMTLSARTPGTTAVAVRRTSCGEAMRCTPAQSRFLLTAVVAG